MRQSLLVAWREFRIRVTSPVYIFLSLLTLILLIGGPVIASSLMESERQLEITVVDHTGWALPKLRSTLDEMDRASGKKSQLALISAEPAEQERLIAEAKQGNLPGLLVLDGSTPDLFSASFSSSDATGVARAEAFLDPVIQAVVRTERLVGYGDVTILQRLQEPVKMEWVQLTTGEQGTGYILRVGVALTFTILMYMGILLYASLTFQGVLEEKVSRVMEVLVSAIRPDALVTGKILGMSMVGLTQVAVWVLAYVVLLNLPLGALSEVLVKISGSILVYMVVYFIFGFVFYASLFAAAASTISRMEDSQTVMAPASIFIIMAYMVSMFALQNPAGTLATWASLIPLFSPTVMITRIAMGEPPLWQVASSLSMLVATTFITIRLAARVYRMGVLMYGSRPSLRFVWAVIRRGA